MPAAERPPSNYTSQCEFQFPCDVTYSASRNLKVRFTVGDDDGGNGRVSHEELADAALRRKPDAAGAS